VAFTRLNPGSSNPDARFEATAAPGAWYKAQLTWDTTENLYHLRTRDGTTYFFGSGTALQGIRDRNGNQLKVYRDGVPDDRHVGITGKVARLVSPSGRWLQLQYVSGTTRISSVRDNLGRVVSYAYRASAPCQNYLQTVTDVDGVSRGYTYDSGCRVQTITDAKGHTVLTNSFDTGGKITGQALAISGVSYSFNYSGTTTTITQPGGSQHRITTNTAGFTTSETFGYGTTEARTLDYTRDSIGRVTTMYDAALIDGSTNRRRTDYTYDSLGNVSTVTR